MTKALKNAIGEVERLPQSDQEKIGRNLLSYVERLRRLRTEVDKGIRSLNARKGRKLNVEAFIRQRHGKR